MIVVILKKFFGGNFILFFLIQREIFGPHKNYISLLWYVLATELIEDACHKLLYW